MNQKGARLKKNGQEEKDERIKNGPPEGGHHRHGNRGGVYSVCGIKSQTGLGSRSGSNSERRNNCAGEKVFAGPEDFLSDKG